MNNQTVQVTTDIFPPIIKQTLNWPGGDVSWWVINTREQQLREALIKLGWTPPPEPNNESENPDR